MPKRSFKNLFSSLVSNVVGIDLGTTNTVVSVGGKIIYNEPTLLVYNKKTDEITIVGEGAMTMLGRTPQHLEVIQPITNGVISDFEVTEELITFLFEKVNESSRKIFGPNVVIGIPSIVSDIDSQTLYDATLGAGAKTVHIVPEPYAAAIGMGLHRKIKNAFLVIDIGGGTTDIMIFAFNGIVASASINVAGQKMTAELTDFFADRYKIAVGKRSVEKLKIAALGRAHNKKNMVKVHGRSLVTNLPQVVIIEKNIIKKVVFPQIQKIVSEIKKMINDVSPDVASDLLSGKAYLVGGGANIDKLADFISTEIKIPVIVPDNPMTVVAQGAAIIAQEAGNHLYGLVEIERGQTPSI